ncbi:MAG: hypothetical protein CYPHOPRED_005273 [Cyphobasidiales sp. Tagirdzhanova-0007]|nr:MAG: hypothetical protein CYPHOPRED_005273 [Cyphobasidiales sp. Tagirdzhanova-0007]
MRHAAACGGKPSKYDGLCIYAGTEIFRKRQPFALLPVQKSEGILPRIVPTQYARLDLPPPVTHGIIKAARLHGTSFSYVVAVAIALSVFNSSTNPADANAVMLPVVPIDGRYRLSHDGKLPYIAYGLISAASMMVPVTMLREIDEVARKTGNLSLFWYAVDELMTKWKAGKSSDLLAALQNETMQYRRGTIKEAPGKVFPPVVYYSPIGKVESIVKQSYGSDSRLITVSRPFLSAQSANLLCLGMQTWSWESQFTVLLNYSTEMYSTDFVKTFSDHVRFYLELTAEVHEQT